MKKIAITKRAMRAALAAIRKMQKNGTDHRAIDDLCIVCFREFVKAGGLVLDPQFWRLKNGAAVAVQDAIELALVNGWSAAKAGSNFIYQGVANEAVHAYVDLSGFSSDADDLNEIFQSEINRAHGMAFMNGGEQCRGFGGWRYLLSPRHPWPDIENLFAVQNLYGLGEGVYPSEMTCPWPAYRGTLSYVEIVFTEEITDVDRAGKETSFEALGRLEPEIREGVLGVIKSMYFDQGLLRSWMIRSPLVSVQRRLVRQGLLDANNLQKDLDPYEEDDDD